MFRAVIWLTAMTIFGNGLASAQSAESPADAFASLNIACWGDSITSGSGGTPYPSQLAALLGSVNVYNGGVSGDTSALTAQRMIATTSMSGYFTILWAGRNNVNSGTVLSDNAAMVASLSSPKHFVVMSLLTTSAEPRGSTNYNAVIAINQQFAAAYPSNYLDIRSYLVSQYNPSSPQDVADYNNDIVPTSLRADSFHLNTTGYGLVAKRLQAYYAAVFGQFYVSGNVLPYILGSPGPIGTISAQMGNFTSLNTSGIVGLGPTTATSGQLTQNGNTLLHTWGGDNLFVGTGRQAAGNFTMTGKGNVGIGAANLNNLTAGGNNLAIGSYALLNATTADSNVGIGTQAMGNALTGSLNVGIGRLAGFSIVNGWYNTFIGFGADAAADIFQSIAIGSQAKVGCSYCAVIGGTGAAALKTGIGVSTPAYPLDVAGTIHSQQGVFDQGVTVAGVAIVAPLKATSALLGGTIAAGACLVQTVPVAGVTASMTAYASPQSDPGAGLFWSAFPASGSVTVRVCSVTAGTAVPVAYNIRAIP